MLGYFSVFHYIKKVKPQEKLGAKRAVDLRMELKPA
jgi:hypothetical protein